MKSINISKLIQRNIWEHGYCLKDMESIIEKEYGDQLNTIDRVYIEDKYIKYCLDYWLDEIDGILNKCATIDDSIIEKFIALHNIRDFDETPVPFNTSRFYNLLIQHKDLIAQHDEEILMRRFKEKCLRLLMTYSNVMIKEIDFLKALLEFLAMFEKCEEYPDMSELRHLYNDDTSNDKFFQAIMDLDVVTYGVKLERLRYATQALMNEEHITLTDKYKEIIRGYFQPVTVKELTIDNRLVIEVIGGNFRLSDVVTQVNTFLSRESSAEEVRFVCSGIIYLDEDLENVLWHGRNIVVYAKAIRVCNTIKWDISGEHAKALTRIEAITDRRGNGMDGEHGKCGESGGNVFIRADNILQPEQLVILANGGDGSNGEKGGDGADGRNGTGISYADFKRKFPSSGMYLGTNAINNLHTTVRNIKSLGDIRTSWQNGHNCSVDKIIKSRFRTNDYVEAVTSEGHEIYFSSAIPGATFVLYKGSKGEEGGRGGAGGLCGEGGYPGEMTCSDPRVAITANPGKKGEEGKNGKCGKHGRNGWDMGYIDWLFWREGIYYGKGENRKIELEYYKSSNAERIYVAHRAFLKSEYTYAQMSTVDIPQSTSVASTERRRVSAQSEYETRAERKKNISQNHIFTQYSQYMTRINTDLYHKLQSESKNAEEYAFAEIMNEKKQQMKEISQVTITRTKPSSPYVRTRGASGTRIKSTEVPISDQPIDILLNLRKGRLIDWSELKNVEVKYSDFDDLFRLFESLKCEYVEKQRKQINDDMSLLNIEQLLIQKYHLATLQQIAAKSIQSRYPISQLNLSEDAWVEDSPQVNIRIDFNRYADLLRQRIFKNNDEQYKKGISPFSTVKNMMKYILTPEKAIRYLVQPQNNSHIDLDSHTELGDLHRYIFEDSYEQRKKISAFCTVKNMAKYSNAFKYSIAAFIMDEGKIKEAHPTIKRYYEEYTNFVGQQEVKMKEFLEESKLEVGYYDRVIAQWFKSLNNASMQAKLERDIKENKRLELLYKRFLKRFNVRFQWDDCRKYPEVLDMYIQHIQNHGPLSPSYRELLAYVFNINICVYITDQDDNINLLDVHNTECTKTVYMLYRNKKSTRLDINQDLLDLDTERENKSDIYMKIIAKVDLLQRKEDCDEYVKEALSLLDDKDRDIDLVSKSTITSESIIDEKQSIYDIIRCFSSLEEKEKLKFLLEKVSSKYVGHCKILQALAKCFSNNGRHVTYDELYCLINTILNFIVEDRPALDIFCWIITAHPQHQWINEIILLKLENHFQRLLLPELYQWKEFLANIRDRETLWLLNSKLQRSKANKNFSIRCIHDILYLLSNILEPMQTGLRQLELSEWPYAIKEKYWATKLSAVTEWEDEKLLRASYYLLSLENSAGTYLVEKFIDIFVQKSTVSQSNKDRDLPLNKPPLNILRKENIKRKLVNADDFLRILSTFYNEEWNFSEKIFAAVADCQIGKWPIMMKEIFPISEKDRDISNLIELIEDNGNTSGHILKDLAAIERIVETMKRTPNDEMITEEIRKHRLNIDIRQGRIAKMQYVQENVAEILGLIDDVIQIKRNIRLRDTQKFAILTLLRNHNTLMQVSTGEGKSLIIVALSILKALCGQKLDIVTSSSVLAKRDADVNSDIYELFSVSVSHNCDNNIERRKEVYSCKNVVYGELAGFQRDYLLDRFYGQNILGDRRFENVVIDEVDSMLLDKGNNTLYLSHDLPCLDKLESVYVYIWQLINRSLTNENYLRLFDNRAIKQAVLRDLHGLVSKERISEHMSSQHAAIVWERLIKHDIINSDGHLLQDDVKEEDVRNVLSSDLKHYECHLVYMFKDITNRNRSICVPNYLKPFVALHLDAWINNAKMALFMQERRDYVVDVDRKGSRPELRANITIIDRDTGTDQATSQWDEALHQFLQLKHGCKLSMQSLKAVFISNVRYLKLYGNMYGLTGTLGSHRERDLLSEIYGADFVTVPTAKARKFHECNPIVCSTADEWASKIREEADALIVAGRSILIICETVEDVESLYRVFNKKCDEQMTHVHTYTRDYESFNMATEDKHLCAGQVIIATNLAGRGTDIKITDELNEAGGLHVCLTYLPNNNRVEQQAFGRAARCGNVGSGRLIILGSHGTYSVSETSRLKTERYFEEIRRISDIKLHYEERISVEEDAFDRFKKEYMRLKESLAKNKDAKEVTETLLRSCLDEWAFWLDENSRYINGSPNEQNTRTYNASLCKLIDRLKVLKAGKNEDWICWTREPAQIVKLGKYFAQNKHQDLAIKLFDRVIDSEPFFSETAHYYKAFSLIKQIDKNDQRALKELKSELRQASLLLEKHRDYALMAGNIIDTLKQKNSGIMQIDAFKDQHVNLSILYQIFLQSIDDIFGHHVTPKSFERYDIAEELAETLYDDMIENGILKKPRISKCFSEKSVKKISERYGIIWNKLNAFIFEQINNDRDIDLKQLEEKLENTIKMPNKEEFWKLLVDSKVLTNEMRYVRIVVKKLRNIDPSFLNLLVSEIDEGRLDKQDINCDKQELIFNVQIDIEENDDITLEEKVLKNMMALKNISDERYEILNRRNVFSFNKKAVFDSSKVDSVIFPQHFDSITVQDFTERGILLEDAQRILTDLVERKILTNEENDNYRLLACYDKIADLSFCGIYENFVMSLLNIRFMYRIALQRLTIDFEEQERPVKLEITSKPHRSIVYSLIDERIVKPAKISNNTSNTKKILKSTYNRVMTKDTFMRVLCENNLIPQISKNKKLFNYIAKKKWINVIETKKCMKKIPMAEVASSIILLSHYNSHANTTDKITVLVDEDTSHYVHSSKDSTGSYENLTETIKKIVDDRNHLGRNNTIENIAAILEGLRNAFGYLDAPDSGLMSLVKHIEANKLFSHGEYPTEELHVFAVNGLDDLLILREKQWTWEMILKTFAVVVLGIMQILLGCAISFLSAGFLSLLSGPLICEGVGDIIFAITTFRSGYFSWNNYMWHKIMSLAITGLTFGIGAWLSRGKSASSLAMEIMGPNVSAGGREITKMTGIEALRQMTRVGSGMVVRAFVKRVAFSTLEAVAFGLASTAVDAVVENYLQNLCRDIGHIILTEIDEVMDKYDMSDVLTRAYQMLGRENAIVMIKEVSNNYMINQNNSELIAFCVRAINSVVEVIKRAKYLQAKSSGSYKIKIFLQLIGPTIMVAKKIIALHELRKLTDTMLSTLKGDIQEKLKQLSTNIQQTQHVDLTDMNNFKQEITDMWKSMLRVQAGQVIDAEIVRPIMQSIAAGMINYAGKQIQSVYRNYKEHVCYKEFTRCKEEYIKSMRDPVSTSDEVRVQLEEEYCNSLRTLLTKTRDPKLFAAIVRENVQMNTTCVTACLSVLEPLLKNHGINVRGLTIIVEDESSRLSEKISTAPEGYETTVITLNLVDGHFQMTGDNTSSDTQEYNASKNNCLYEALCQRIPELRNLSADEFREQIANEIERNPEIRERLSYGWHRYKITAGLIGGRKKPTRNCNVTNMYGQKDVMLDSWQFNKEVDENLTKEGTLNNEQLHEQRAKALNSALKKCKEYLKRTRNPDRKGEVCVEVDDFYPTAYDRVFLSDPKNGTIEIGYYPVEMRAEVQVLVPGTCEKATVWVEINIDDPCVSPVQNGPKVPHVGYKITGSKPVKEYKTCGHVLVNEGENAFLPHRHPKNIIVDSGISDNIAYPIPIDRLFHSTREPTEILESEREYDVSTMRGKSFMSIFM